MHAPLFFVEETSQSSPRRPGQRFRAPTTGGIPSPRQSGGSTGFRVSGCPGNSFQGTLELFYPRQTAGLPAPLKSLARALDLPQTKTKTTHPPPPLGRFRPRHSWVRVCCKQNQNFPKCHPKNGPPPPSATTRPRRPLIDNKWRCPSPVADRLRLFFFCRLEASLRPAFIPESSASNLRFRRSRLPSPKAVFLSGVISDT